MFGSKLNVLLLIRRLRDSGTMSDDAEYADFIYASSALSDCRLTEGRLDNEAVWLRRGRSIFRLSCCWLVTREKLPLFHCFCCP